MANVLLIDDSANVREKVRATLEQEGLHVIEAEDGISALNIVKGRSDLDLIITDLNMPGMSGLVMVELIRKLPHGGSVPILMLTTEMSSERKAEGKSLGLDGWIVKPFNGVKAMPAIKALLARNVRS